MKRKLIAVASTCLAAAPATLPRIAEAAKKQSTVKEPTKDDDQAQDLSGESTDTGDENNATETKPMVPVHNSVALPPSDPSKPPPADAAIPTVNETHTVVKGDTLWDLSQHYLGNPWYWPKVWSYNPQIANPHWIYPGDHVKFSTAGGPETTDAEAPTEVQPVGEGDDDTQTPDDEGPIVSSSRKIGYVEPKNSSFRQDGFVTDRELEESGQITRSFSETEMLDVLDKVYTRFKSAGDAKPGERFFIYNTVREIKHPLNGERYGYLTHIVGVMKITGTVDGVVTGVIEKAFDEIRRGDYLAPYSERLNHAVAQKPASKPVQGIILEGMVQTPEYGEDEVVFVDKGKRDGLEEGNVLDITRRVDGLISPDLRPGDKGYEDSKLPAEIIGKLLVVDVKDGASTCIVLKSAREIRAGDRFIAATTEAGSSTVSLR